MRLSYLALAAGLLTGCAPASDWSLQAADPAAVPADVPVPSENPVTRSKVELGFRLWFETRLSANNQMSCATCHDHRKGFSNGEATAAGVSGQRGARNVPTVYGAAYQPHLFWDGREATLEGQALAPITNPVEMASRMGEVIAKLEAMPYYRHKFKEAFDTGPTPEGIGKAIASFERALTVGPSPYDRFTAGDREALTAPQHRGLLLFNSRRTTCSLCHNGKTLTNGLFANTGAGTASASPDPGRGSVSGQDGMQGAFKTPTLLNVAQTAPYMHDGSLATLEAVIDFYDRGGGPAANRHPAVRPLALTPQEKADLVAFMNALTGPDNLKAIAGLPGIRLPSEDAKQLGIPSDLLP